MTPLADLPPGAAFHYRGADYRKTGFPPDDQGGILVRLIHHRGTGTRPAERLPGATKIWPHKTKP